MGVEFGEKKKEELCSLVTIVTPTMNRPDFIVRYLQYYSKTGFSGDIIIGDSSDDENRKKVEDAVKKYGKNLSLRYGYYPTAEYAHDGECFGAMLELVRTPYTIFCGDDDFLILEGLARCVEFIEQEEGYAGVFGERVAFQLNQNGPSGKIVAMARRNTPERLHDSALERLNSYITEGMSTQYSVSKTDLWKVMYSEVPNMPARYIGSEFFPCCIAVLHGKFRKLDELLVLFQQNLDPIFNWNKQTLFALMNTPEWSPSMAVGRKQIIELLVKFSDLTAEHAEAYVDIGIWHHMLNSMNAQYSAVSEGRSLRPGINPDKGARFLDEFMQNSDYRRVSMTALKILAGVR
ncbi:MAG TPA: hypothetical protein DCS48_13200 [Desulfovibrio sp.]|nr:hypothetical protein [Desulfovibrio sp.]